MYVYLFFLTAFPLLLQVDLSIWTCILGSATLYILLSLLSFYQIIPLKLVQPFNTSLKVTFKKILKNCKYDIYR